MLTCIGLNCECDTIADEGLTAATSEKDTSGATENSTTGLPATSDDSASDSESTSNTSDTTTTDSSTGNNSDATTTDSSTSNTSDATTTGVEPQPDDSMCSADADCISESCFVVPLFGGLCGECKVDADCDSGGCTIPNPLAGVGATCNKGEAGAGCESNDVCVDPNNSLCGLVLDATPIIKVQTCGECKTYADCSDDAAPNCSPTIDVNEFTGINTCVPDGSVGNDKACNLVEEGGVPIGNSACESGKCGVAALMGVVKIGICGECFVDEDCDGGTCEDAFVDTDTGELIGSKCD